MKNRENCPDCAPDLEHILTGGSGKCNHCRDFPTFLLDNCECNGTGQCQTCGGTGYIWEYENVEDSYNDDEDSYNDDNDSYCSDYSYCSEVYWQCKPDKDINNESNPTIERICKYAAIGTVITGAIELLGTEINMSFVILGMVIGVLVGTIVSMIK